MQVPDHFSEMASDMWEPPDESESNGRDIRFISTADRHGRCSPAAAAERVPPLTNIRMHAELPQEEADELSRRTYFRKRAPNASR